MNLGTGILGTELLIYESSAAQRFILEALLCDAGYTPRMVVSSDEAMAEITTGRYGIFITNLEHADTSGLELFWELKASEATRGIHTIAITASNEKKTLISALDSGADDFLRKPIDMAELKARLRVAQRSLQLQSNIVRLALTDALTGIANRRAFLDRMKSEISRSERQGGQLCVAMLDIDYFKKVNDTYGHAVGDRVICEVANLAAQEVRACDFIGRLGGEEFAILMPDTSLKDAKLIVERVRKELETHHVQIEGGTSVSVTISIGLTSRQAEEGPEALLGRADEALYEAKEKGRNQAIVA